MEILAEMLPSGIGVQTEVAPDWMRRPGRVEFGNAWFLISAVYQDLTGLVLPELAPRREHRRLDVLLTYPDGQMRVFEFDEAQHFTDARYRTLAFYESFDVAFNVEDWRSRSRALIGREPGGGFGKPKPPLFPGDGGRHRQRAFRDFIADLMPSQRDGWLPTARIHYVEANSALASASQTESFADLWEQRTGEAYG